MSEPVQLLLSRLENVRQVSEGQYTARCPAHDDKENSLSVGTGREGQALAHCFAGCTTPAIVDRIGLKMQDLYPAKTAVAIADRPLTLAELAADKAIPAEYLRKLGVKQVRAGVLIPYLLADGSRARRQRVRTALKAKDGSRWAGTKGESPVPYGLWMLDRFKGDFLVFVEGESDAWTLWHHGIPALGIPGADMAGKIEPGHVQAFRRIYVVQEPDQGGRTFVAGVVTRLQKIGWAGEVLVIQMPTTAKDPNELHKQDPAGFNAAFRALLQSARTPSVAVDIGGDGRALSAATKDVPPSFWLEIKKKGGPTEIKIDQSALVDFWHFLGYGKRYEFGSQTSTIVRRQGNVLERVSTEQIKDVNLRYVETLSSPFQDEILAGLRKGANVYFSRYLVECLPVLDGEFLHDDRYTAHFFFRNAWVRVTAAGVEASSYETLPGFIWKDQIMQRDFHPVDFSDQAFLEAEFGRFLWNVVRQNPERLGSLCAAIGYLLHGFKNPALARAICFVDEVVSDVPSGRSGKGLVMKAIGQLVPTLHVDARNFRFDSQFSFQGIIPGVTRLVHFSDASQRFPFERLFALITDDMSVEEKNRPRVIIPFDQSPKLGISTNYIIEGQGGSHEDRIFEIEFSDHYNERHKPEAEFGHLFFTGWDADEWNRFDNVMLRCAQVFLRDGLRTYQHVNLETKKLIQQTSAEFCEFVEENRYRANTPERAKDPVNRLEYSKSDEFEAFCKMYPDAGIEQRDFTKFLKIYARLRGWQIDERRGTGGKDRHIWFIGSDA